MFLVVFRLPRVGRQSSGMGLLLLGPEKQEVKGGALGQPEFLHSEVLLLQISFRYIFNMLIMWKEPHLAC